MIRPGVGPGRAKDGSVHVSEIALDDYEFDVVLENDRTLEELHATVTAMAAGWVVAREQQRRKKAEQATQG